MFETTSLFDALAADETERHVARRRALALAHTKVENRLGAFLRGAVTMEEFEARLAACEDDLRAHVAEASAETGHDHPEHIAKALIDHYASTRRWQPRQVEADHWIQKAVKKPGELHRELGVPQGEKIPESKLEEAEHSDNPKERERAQFAENVKGLGKGKKSADEKHDPGKMQDSNDGKGVLEPHQDDEDAKDGKPKDASIHTADGNTDLGGPEPKMDKRLWTPQAPGEPKVDDGKWKTEQKDITEPMGPPNNEHPLKEIGDIEHQTLPTATGDEAGFASGGVDSGPHTDTFGGSGQVDPVTKSDLS